jgi:hypothetical protein
MHAGRVADRRAWPKRRLFFRASFSRDGWAFLVFFADADTDFTLLMLSQGMPIPPMAGIPTPACPCHPGQAGDRV